jgi:protein-arginine kinase activator protein McsA
MPKVDAKGPKMCESCSEQPAQLKVTATDLEGKLLDTMTICVDCTDEQVVELLPGVEDAGK